MMYIKMNQVIAEKSDNYNIYIYYVTYFISAVNNRTKFHLILIYIVNSNIASDSPVTYK